MKRKKVYMNKCSERKIGIILQYSQMFLSVLISFIYTPMMLRLLGQEEYGMYNLANSIISYLSLLSLGFGASYIRYYSKYKKNGDSYGIKRLNGLFIIVFTVMGLIAFIAGLFISSNVAIFFNNTYSFHDLKIARILMIFMSINISLSFQNSVFTAYIIAQEKFIFQKLLNMLKSIVSPFLTLLLLLMGFGSIGIVVVTTLITIVVDLINIFFCIHKLNMKFDFHKPDLGLLKEVAIFSLFIALNQLVDQINWATDKVVLGKVCSSATVAIYAIGSQINTYYLQFSTAISGVFIPKIHKIVASTDKECDKNYKLTQIFVKVGRIQFIILLLILTGFIFFGEYFILIWAGKEYSNAYYVALLLIIPVTIPLIQNIGIEIQRAKNMHQFRSYIYLCMAIFNIVITIFLAKKWGELGAALGTGVSVVLANGIIMNLYYYKKIGIDIIYFWKEIIKFIPALIIPSILGILFSMNIYKSLKDFILYILIYIIAYSLSMYFIGMNKYEKDLINRSIYKIKLIK